MTGAVALTVVVAFFALDAAAEACEGKPVKRHKAEAFESIDRAYRHDMWREPSLVTNKLRNHWQAKKACLHNWGRKRVSRYRDNRVQSREAWRDAKRAAWRAEQFRKEYRPYGPCGSAGYLAIPCYVAWCESGYRWYIHSGMYGILDSSWNAFGGQAYGAYPGAASADGQSIVATRILRAAGPGAWECW